jgi:signal transduction histidine kinase
VKESTVSTGVYEVFRLSLLIRLLFDLSNLFALTVFPPPGPYLRPTSTYASIVEIIFLMIFLTWKNIRAKLGRFHLPIALAIATVGPVFEDYLSGYELLSVINKTSIEKSPIANELIRQYTLTGQLQHTIFIILPLVMVAWEYRYRWVVLYCSLLTILNTATVSLIFSQIHAEALYRAIGMMITRLVFYLFFGYIINRLVTEQNKDHIRLASANRQLAGYASTLEQLTISRERNRLARELHDTIAHTLSGVAIQLEAVNTLWDNAPEKAHPLLMQSLANTRGGLNETRRAIQALRATPLEDLGLCLAIQTLAYSFEERYGIKVHLHLAETLPDLPQNIEHCFYRIAEESLRNVEQHSKAKNIFIELNKDERECINLSVRDDGIGFDLNQAEPGDHFGLRGIRERADEIGATVRIESEQGKGTGIHLTMEKK